MQPIMYYAVIVAYAILMLPLAGVAQASAAVCQVQLTNPQIGLQPIGTTASTSISVVGANGCIGRIIRTVWQIGATQQTQTFHLITGYGVGQYVVSMPVPTCTYRAYLLQDSAAAIATGIATYPSSIILASSIGGSGTCPVTSGASITAELPLANSGQIIPTTGASSWSAILVAAAVSALSWLIWSNAELCTKRLS